MPRPSSREKSDLEVKIEQWDHGRGDETAERESGILARLQRELTQRLRRAFPRLPEDACHDAVTDAIMDYLGAPGKFHPDRGASLWRRLLSAAWRNGADAIRRDRRYSRLLADFVRNGLCDHIASPTPEVALLGRERRRSLVQLVSKPGDRRMLELLMNGETVAQVLARALGVTDDGQRTVRRAKDRIRRLLRRRLAAASRRRPPDDVVSRP